VIVTDVARARSAVMASGDPSMLICIHLPPAQVIDGDVVGDLEQPAGEFELGPVAIDVVEDLDERFLREIFGGLGVAHHAIYERENGSLISLDKLAVGVFTPFLGEDDHLLVGYVGVGP